MARWALALSPLSFLLASSGYAVEVPRVPVQIPRVQVQVPHVQVPRVQIPHVQVPHSMRRTEAPPINTKTNTNALKRQRERSVLEKRNNAFESETKLKIKTATKTQNVTPAMVKGAKTSLKSASVSQNNSPPPNSAPPNITNGSSFSDQYGNTNTFTYKNGQWYLTGSSTQGGGNLTVPVSFSKNQNGAWNMTVYQPDGSVQTFVCSFCGGGGAQPSLATTEVPSLHGDLPVNVVTGPNIVQDIDSLRDAVQQHTTEIQLQVQDAQQIGSAIKDPPGYATDYVTNKANDAVKQIAADEIIGDAPTDPDDQKVYDQAKDWLDKEVDNFEDKVNAAYKELRDGVGEAGEQVATKIDQIKNTMNQLTEFGKSLINFNSDNMKTVEEGINNK